MKSPRIFIALVTFAVAIALGVIYYIHREYPNQVNPPVDLASVPTQFPTASSIGSSGTNSSNPSSDSSVSSQPSTLLLKVPFTSQAPTANWDQVHNEDCEEATAVMANAYFSGNTSATLTASLVDQQMTDLNNWEQQNFGYNLDITSDEDAQMISKVYGLRTKLTDNFTEQDIKSALQENHLVIISVDGQKVGNPNYKQPGPIHHMLLVRGYTPEQLITNDSGTRRGENYPYAFQTIHDAAADWDHATNTVNHDKKVMIEVWK